MYFITLRDGTEVPEHFPSIPSALEYFEARWHGSEFSRNGGTVEIRERDGSPAATIQWRDWEFYPGKV